MLAIKVVTIKNGASAIMVLHPSTTPRLKVHITINWTNRPSLILTISIISINTTYHSARSNHSIHTTMSSEHHQQAALMTLPPELLLQIIPHIPHNPKDLRALKATNRYFNTLLTAHETTLVPAIRNNTYHNTPPTLPLPPPRILRPTRSPPRPPSNPLRPPRQLATPHLPRPRTQLAPRSMGIDPQSRHSTPLPLARLQQRFWQYRQRRRALVKSRPSTSITGDESGVFGV